jgi:hypothetical protein
MADDFGMFTKLDRLPPLEKMGDSKRRVVQQDVPHKKREERPKREESENDQEMEKEPDDPSKKPNSGKILDIVI